MRQRKKRGSIKWGKPAPPKGLHPKSDPLRRYHPYRLPAGITPRLWKVGSRNCGSHVGPHPELRVDQSPLLAAAERAGADALIVPCSLFYEEHPADGEHLADTLGRRLGVEPDLLWSSADFGYHFPDFAIGAVPVGQNNDGSGLRGVVIVGDVCSNQYGRWRDARDNTMKMPRDENLRNRWWALCSEPYLTRAYRAAMQVTRFEWGARRIVAAYPGQPRAVHQLVTTMMVQGIALHLLTRGCQGLESLTFSGYGLVPSDIRGNALTRVTRLCRGHRGCRCRTGKIDPMIHQQHLWWWHDHPADFTSFEEKAGRLPLEEVQDHGGLFRLLSSPDD